MLVEGRLGMNGCRYWVSESYDELYQFCVGNAINPQWIRRKKGKYYLRLWGSYRNKGRRT